MKGFEKEIVVILSGKQLPMKINGDYNTTTSVLYYNNTLESWQSLAYVLQAGANTSRYIISFIDDNIIDSILQEGKQRRQNDTFLSLDKQNCLRVCVC